MKKKFFGWGYLQALIVMISFAFLPFYILMSTSVFSVYLEALKGIPKSNTMYAYTVGAFASAVMQIFFGKVIQKTGVKPWIVGGAIIGGINFALIPRMPTPFLTYVLVCLNVFFQVFWAGQGIILIGKWFPRKKGSIMGIVTGATLFGSLVMLPTFNRVIGSRGLGSAMLIFGVILAAYGVICLLALRETPEAVGCLPDNMPMREEERAMLLAKANEKTDWNIKTFFSNKALVFTTLGWGLQLMASVGFSSTATIVFVSKGYSMEGAVALASFSGVASLVGSVVSGFMDQKMGTKKVCYIFMGLQICSFVICAAATSNTLFLIPVGYYMCMFMGGAPNNLMPSSIINKCGVVGLAVSLNIFSGASSILKSLGSSVVTAAYDITGNYTIVFIIFAAISILATAFIALGKPTEREYAAKKTNG